VEVVVHRVQMVHLVQVESKVLLVLPELLAQVEQVELLVKMVKMV
jgi:hypothetical protein